MSNEKIIAQNVLQVLDRIEKAAENSDRRGSDVQMVAVTKYVGMEIVDHLYRAGVRLFGESRPQVLWDKVEQSNYDDVRWHLIGHLQRNKVKRTIGKVELIHSVDSLRLLEEIDRCSREQQRPTNILLEVNISGESAKHGLQTDQLREMIDRSLETDFVTVCGFMGMGGLASTESEVRAEFASLRQTRDQMRDAYQSESIELEHLSMGMSSDFELAIAEGATMVRIGSILFDGIQR